MRTYIRECTSIDKCIKGRRRRKVSYIGKSAIYAVHALKYLSMCVYAAAENGGEGESCFRAAAAAEILL